MNPTKYEASSGEKKISGEQPQDDPGVGARRFENVKEICRA